VNRAVDASEIARSRRQPRRILFARAVDAGNLNAQVQNTKEILARWRSEIWRPTVVSFGAPDPRVASNTRVDIVRIADDRWWRLRFWRLYQDRFDAIFYPGLHHRADNLALRARALTGRKIPVVATIEELVGGEEDQRLFAAIAGHPVFCHDVERRVGRRYDEIRDGADALIAISPFLARMARAKYGNKVSVLGLGVDTAVFRPIVRSEQRRAVVVGAGTVGDRKRPELFLELAHRFPGADFRWFGEGATRQALVNEANRRGLANLSFPGALMPADLAYEFARARIFVLPSKAEGAPRVTQEAAACGLPQIVFGYCEAPGVVDGVNGFVVWNDDQLVQRLGQLLGDPSLEERMGRAGAELAKEWSWDRLAPLWEERIIACAEAPASRGVKRFATPAEVS